MMIQVQFSHLDYNVSDIRQARDFYDPLMEVLGMEREYARPDVVLYGNRTFKFCLVQVEQSYLETGFHRKRPGLNHIAFSVNAREDVDRLYREYLVPNDISVLYHGPGQFADSIEYYAVFFEDPFRLKVEVVYAPHYLQLQR